VRSFSAANAGNLVSSLGFYALLLCNVLILTGVWGWSTLHAGLALTPGPLTAAVLAPLAGRISDRYGQRVVAAPGGLCSPAGTSPRFRCSSRPGGPWRRPGRRPACARWRSGGSGPGTSRTSTPARVLRRSQPLPPPSRWSDRRTPFGHLELDSATRRRRGRR